MHWLGIRIDGLRGYLRHYLDPNPILRLFHLLGENTRTLAVRLFGNMMSLEMAALLVLLVAGFLTPVSLVDAAPDRGAGAGLHFRHLGTD